MEENNDRFSVIEKEITKIIDILRHIDNQLKDLEKKSKNEKV